MVSVIVLNFNGLKFLKDCLDSVFAQSYPDFELILFDNASTDGSIQFLKDNFADSRLKLVESKTNLGFAGGNNEALKHTSCDTVVLLNNDTVVDKDWLRYLVEAVKDGNTVASSFVITEGVDKKYYETNGSVSYMMYNVMNKFENIEDEFYPNGCSLIFRKSEIGEPFDPDYFYYSEDLYLGLKARFKGMKVKFVKESVVHHFGGGSGTASSQRTFYQERNRFLNLYTFFSIGFILRVELLIFFHHNLRILQSIYSSKYSFTGLIKAYLWFYLHIPLVLKKRRQIHSLKNVNEKDIIKYMSSNLVNDEGAFNKLINRLSYFYSRIVLIKPLEYFKI